MAKKKNKLKNKAVRESPPFEQQQNLTMQQALNLAVQYHRAGDLAEAEGIYQQILQAQPNQPVILQLLGVITHQNGKNNIAEEYFTKAIKIKPDYADAHSNLGLVLQAMGRIDDAIASYQKTIKIKSDHTEAHYNLGVALQIIGKPREAATHFSSAIKINPGYAKAHYSLGNTLQALKQLDDAVIHYHKAIKIKPDYAEALFNLARAMQSLGQLNEAATYFNQAAEIYVNLGNALQASGKPSEAGTFYHKAIEIKPEYAVAHNNLGISLLAQGQQSEAVTSFHQAIKVDPQYAEAYYNLGASLQDLEQLSEAATYFQKAIEIRPDSAKAHNSLGNVLQTLGKLSETTIYYQKAIDIINDLDVSEQVRMAEKENLTPGIIYSNLLLGLNYHSELSKEAVFTKHLEWEKIIGEPLIHKGAAPDRARKKHNQLRIGYISPDFKTHSVAYFFEPLLLSHNRREVEVYCYYNHEKIDSTTQRFQEYSDHWRSIANMTDEEVINLIQQDNIDILVDLAGHTARNRLSIFTVKPAPIQITWLGYPNTTGLSSMDYRFTDNVADPVGEADPWYTEELIRLPNGFLCYQGDDTIVAEAKLPSRDKGYVTFGSFNSLTKVSPLVIKRWGKILKAVPGARLLLKSKQLLDELSKLNLWELFEEEGIEKERIELIAWLSKKEDHLALYSRIDIGLDPFPFNGATTTCEALWMGVPTITLAGDRHVGRVGASIMKQVGLNDFIADDLASYVDLAVQHANDPEHLSSIRKGLRARMESSKLCDGPSFAKNVEAAYRKMWEKYQSC